MKERKKERKKEELPIHIILVSRERKVVRISIVGLRSSLQHSHSLRERTLTLLEQLTVCFEISQQFRACDHASVDDLRLNILLK